MINDLARPSACAAPHGGRRIPRRRCRSGFTLVELLVVMAIIVALSAIMLAFLPKAESKLAADGAAQLQTWLGSARSRAVREQSPTGLRLLPPGSGPYTSAQLIQTPQPLYAPFKLSVATGSTTATISGLLSDVLPGDFLEIVYGTGSIHQITSVSQGTGSTTLTLASSPPAAAVAPLTLNAPTLNTPNPPYRFIRQPQPLMGEPALELPNTVIVLGVAGPGAGASPTTVPGSYNLQTGGNTDIIFGPSGQIISGTSGGARIILWVWDQNQVSAPTLLTIYANTGAVSAHPIAPWNSSQPISPSNNPYAYTQDGQSSGQ